MLKKDVYCRVCGNKLKDKYLKNEGTLPYCERCEEFRFRMFNTAISAIIYNPSGDKVLLIQQYKSRDNILVAGYVNLGESAEQTLIREIREELGLGVTDYEFNASGYFDKSNTLMINFACHVHSDDLDKTNEEIEYAKWYTVSDAKKNILHNSLAEEFLLKWTEKHGSQWN